MSDEESLKLLFLVKAESCHGEKCCCWREERKGLQKMVVVTVKWEISSVKLWEIETNESI